MEMRDKMAATLINMVELEITIPLDNTLYKKIHTNSFIKLDKQVLGEKERNIYKAMGKVRGARHTEFRDKIWYVKGVSIKGSDTGELMTLTLSPLATVYESKGSIEANTTKTSSAGNTTTSKTTSSSEFKAPNFLSKTDKEWAVSVVQKAVGSTSKEYNKAAAIDKAFKSHILYDYYYDADKTRGGKNYKSAWNKNHLNCADGANLLCALFLTAGLNAWIVHVTDHYLVEVKIGGKIYRTDNAANSGNHTKCKFGKACYHGNYSGSKVGSYIKW